MNKIVDTFENRLQYAMDIRGKRQIDICNHFGWPRSTMSQYCDPLVQYKPKADRMYKLAEYLNVNPTWLMGYDVPMSGLDEREKLLRDISDMDAATLKRFTAYMKAFESVDKELNHEPEQIKYREDEA